MSFGYSRIKKAILVADNSKLTFFVLMLKYIAITVLKGPQEKGLGYNIVRLSMRSNPRVILDRYVIRFTSSDHDVPEQDFLFEVRHGN